MSDDEPDESLLELLRLRQSQYSKLNDQSETATKSTGVLSDAEYIYNNTTDVVIDMKGTQSAARLIWEQMQSRSFSTKVWSEHELHPIAKNEATLNFIFTMDLMNFSFWTPSDDETRYRIAYRDKTWTGYNGLVAVISRALDEGVPLTTPSFWIDEDALTTETFRQVFRSTSAEEMPLLDERLEHLREAGRVLVEHFDGSVVKLIESAEHSAATLINLLVDKFVSFRDVATFQGRQVRLLKRASIFVADVWAAFDGQGYGQFDDIDVLTMFPDYRVPQILHSLGCIKYSPPLEHHIRSLRTIENGDEWEVSIRGCSIWSVELIRISILKTHPDAKVNAVLLDFFLYGLAKEREAQGHDSIPTHRTRCIYY